MNEHLTFVQVNLEFLSKKLCFLTTVIDVCSKGDHPFCGQALSPLPAKISVIELSKTKEVSLQDRLLLGYGGICLIRMTFPLCLV